MTQPNARQAVDLILAAMFCRQHPDRMPHSFMYEFPPSRSGGRMGFEVHYDMKALLQAALFLRRHAAPHLRSVAVKDVETAITGFVSDNFWILSSEAWEACLLTYPAAGAADPPYAAFLSTAVVAEFAETLARSTLFVEPRELTVFPLVVVRVEQEFESPDFFLTDAEGLRPGGVSQLREPDIVSNSFPPFLLWEGIRHQPSSWLGVRAGQSEVAKRMRAAILGALALLPHDVERYQFSLRKLFGGYCTLADDRFSMTLSDPHTPALSEDLVIGAPDEPWLTMLAAKLASPAKADRRQMRALEYFYRAWVPDAAGRFPTLFGAIDAIYGDPGRATQSVIEAVGPVMGAAYDYDRLKLLLGLRASVVHGGAPNVYESSAYHRYYERFEADATRDFEVIVSTCLRVTIFGSLMKQRPHTHAALFKQHTGRDI